MIELQRPLGAAELAGAAIRLALTNYRQLVRCVGVVLLPTAVVGGVAFGYWRSVAASSSGTGSLARAALVVGVVVVILGNLFAQATGVHAATSEATVHDANWRRSLEAALQRRSACVIAGVLVVVLSGIGLIVAILPGVYLFFMWFVTMPLVVLEGRAPREALGRSWQLVRGRWWSVFGSYLIIEFVIVICSLPLGVVVGALFRGASTREVVAEQIATFLVQMLLMPLQVALVAIVYLDLRLQKEGMSREAVALELRLSPDDPNGSDGAASWNWPTSIGESPATETTSVSHQSSAPSSRSGGSSWRVSPKPSEQQIRDTRERATSNEPPATDGQSIEPAPPHSEEDGASASGE